MKVTRQQLEALRELVWMEDISSPTVPEYVEHHESIQKILKAIDNLLIEQSSADIIDKYSSIKVGDRIQIKVTNDFDLWCTVVQVSTSAMDVEYLENVSATVYLSQLLAGDYTIL